MSVAEAVPAMGSARSEPPAVVLASGSATRARLLAAAGIGFRIDAPRVDEAEVKQSLKAVGAAPVAIAETLAELKAQRISRRHVGALVIGADQVLDCAGTVYDKPTDAAAARRQLLALRGHRHELICAVVVLCDGNRIWHCIDRAGLTMREFGDGFLDCYLAAAGTSALASVGAYQLEGPGVQLFQRIEGDYFTILGLPLLPLLGFLREHGVIAS